MIKAAWLAQFQATGCWSKGDSNRESLRDAFVNVWHLPRSSRPNVSFRKPRRANSQMPLTALQSTWSKREPATVRYRVDTGLPASRGTPRLRPKHAFIGTLADRREGRKVR